MQNNKLIYTFSPKNLESIYKHIIFASSNKINKPMRGKKGTSTQTGMYVKIENDLLDKLKQVPSWNMNKNLTINVTLRIGLRVIEKELNKQKTLEL